MKKLFLTGIAVLFLATGTAHVRNSDWPDQIVGIGTRITCAQFDKLSKADKEKAMEWALGYVSGMATMMIEEAKGKDHERFDWLIDHKLNEAEVRAAIKHRCDNSGTWFPLAVEWAFAELPR